MIPPDPDFTVTVRPVNGFVERTGSVDYAVSVDPVSGFDQDVLLRVSSVLPDDVRAAFDSTTLRSPYTTSSDADVDDGRSERGNPPR